MSKEPLVLAYDYGTQSVRAIIFDKFGNTICQKKVQFEPYYSIAPGFAEQDAEVYWDNLVKVTHLLKEANPEAFAAVEAVSITTIRDTVVIMDKDGKVMRPVILWLDQREVKNPESRIPYRTKLLMQILGMYGTMVMQCKAPPCNWLKDFEPETFKNMHRYVMFSCFMTYRLTGNMIDSVANQIGHIPFDYKRQTWQKPSHITYCVTDVKSDKMPDLKRPGEILGRITKEVAEQTGLKEGLPLIASGSDKGCETLGVGAIGSDVCSLSFGTTATVQITTKKYVEPQTFIPAYPAVLNGMYNPEIQIYRGYWMLTWFKQQFAIREQQRAEELGISTEEVLNQRLCEIPAGSDGLVIQPYWSPGIKTPDAKGAAIGFSDVHTRMHLYRAIIEGIGFGLYDGMKMIEKRAKYDIKRVMVSGGGSQSDEICQITANLFGLPVQKVQTYETSALGAAITAFTGIGVYPSFEDAIKQMVRVTKTYEPDMEEHKVYDEIYRKVYAKIYPANKPLYAGINEILEKQRIKNKKKQGENNG